MARIEAILDWRWLTNNGPFVREFEQRIADLLGARNVVATCNATVALEIAARALGLTGEVIVPAFTFVATAHALDWQGIRPVFADIDPATHNMDPASVERCITPATTGIVGVHVWGRACDTDALEEIGRRRGLQVMYDASHAFGCSHKGRMLGTFGRCEVFSFHSTKFINSFEGGAIVTQDDALAERLRLMRNFGFEGYDNVVELGVNGKMSEVCAAMGLTSLEAMDAIVEINRGNHAAYAHELAGIPGITLLSFNPMERHNYQYVVVEVDSTLAGTTRDSLLEALHAGGVLARRYFWPGCHRMEPYRSRRGCENMSLPSTEEVGARVLHLPNGQEIHPGSVDRICQIIRTSLPSSGLRSVLKEKASGEGASSSGTRQAS